MVGFTPLGHLRGLKTRVLDPQMSNVEGRPHKEVFRLKKALFELGKTPCPGWGYGRTPFTPPETYEITPKNRGFIAYRLIWSPKGSQNRGPKVPNRPPKQGFTTSLLLESPSKGSQGQVPRVPSSPWAENSTPGPS